MIPKTPSQPISLSTSAVKNESEFYATLRRYTERLKQQRDISLAYLSKINQLQAQIRVKDNQIDRLNRLNKQLADKLSLYTSVIERSQPKRSMRMSMLLGKNGMTQSIIQTKQQPHEVVDSMHPFEQFFIIEYFDNPNQYLNHNSNQNQNLNQNSDKFRFRLNFEASRKQQHNFVLDFFRNNRSTIWQPQPMTINNSDKRLEFVMYLSNSSQTVKANKQISYEIIDLLNPSYYYFITCMIQREVISIAGKLCWVPVVYGFVTLLPFPDVYFRLLQQVAIEIKNRNQLDQNKLIDSLNQLIKCPVQMSVQTRYLFMNKLHFWKVPDINNIDHHALAFSLGVIDKFALELIIDVLIFFLLEIPITLISQDQLLLCQFMFYFLYIIKPLKYPYPIIFNVTQGLHDLLQSPFPTFTGCTDAKIVEPYLNERAVFDLDRKIAKSWPMLDHLDTSREFLMRVANHAGNYSRFSLVTQQIIKGHQYRELEPYWKDFSKTQLYQNYIHKL